MAESMVNVPPYVLLCAFRYALGRRTYVVGEIAGLLRAHKDKLVPLYGRKIVDEIDHAIEHNLAGEAMDISRWVDVRNEYAKAIGVTA